MGEKHKSIKANVGASVFMDAEVIDCTKIILNIGLGILIEMTQKEAIPLINIRVQHLNSKLTKLKVKQKELINYIEDVS